MRKTFIGKKKSPNKDYITPQKKESITQLTNT